MILYSEEKIGRKSIYHRIVTDKNGIEISRRTVEIPLYVFEKDNRTMFILYDDNMNILKDPCLFLNSTSSDISLKTRRRYAYAIRMLYIFLAIMNYDVYDLNLAQLNELKRFLQGLNSNPDRYKTETMRSNNTVNIYLSVYRDFFKDRNIECPPLFDAKITVERYTFENDFEGTATKLEYKNNLRTYETDKHTVPKYISPEEFEKLYRAAVAKKDKLAQCIMRLMYCYGLRLGEVLGLTIEDITETSCENQLVPQIIIRNRMSDKDFQYAKNLPHVKNTAAYRSHDYVKAKHSIIIDYGLYDLLIDYLSEAHAEAMEKHPDNYKKTVADVASYRNRPDENYYVFLSSKGTVLSAQCWGIRLKKYFEECGLIVDHSVREHNLSHRFRHGFAMLHAHFRKDPVNALELQKLMRHKSLSSTMIYYNPTQEEEFKIKEEFISELFELIPALKEGHKIYE